MTTNFLIVGITDSLDRIQQDGETKNLTSTPHNVSVLRDLKTLLSAEKISSDTMLKKKTSSKPQPTISYESISFINSLQKIISKQSLNFNLTASQSDSWTITQEQGRKFTKNTSTQYKFTSIEDIKDQLVKRCSNESLCSSDFDTIYEETASDQSMSVSSVNIGSVRVLYQPCQVEYYATTEDVIQHYYQIKDGEENVIPLNPLIYLKEAPSTNSETNSDNSSDTDCLSQTL